MKMMKEIPLDERPRERLLNFGPSALSNSELLAIILKTGTREKSVIDISFDILKEIDNLNSLQNITLQKLSSIKGVGKVKALTLIAAMEFGKRIYFEKEKPRKKLMTAKDIYLDSRYLFYNKQQEYFYCLYFNQKNELLERKLLFMGTLNRSIVHPREVFKEAYLVSASGIICIHNHPSGDINPSLEDIRFTESLHRIGEIQGISLLDHLIITDNSYYSFYEHGKI